MLVQVSVCFCAPLVCACACKYAFEQVCICTPVYCVQVCLCAYRDVCLNIRRECRVRGRQYGSLLGIAKSRELPG